MKKITFLIIIFTISVSLKSQTKVSDGVKINSYNKGFDSKKIVYGADFQFGISDSYWSIGISPQIGYKFLPQLHAGVGISYIHGDSRSEYYGPENNSYGVNLFAYYYPWRRIVVKFRPDFTWTRQSFDYDYYDYNGDRIKYSSTHFTPSAVVGVGFHFKPVMILLNYDLVQDDDSALSDNVFFSVGVMF